jgi:hypothetical protein
LPVDWLRDHIWCSSEGPYRRKVANYFSDPSTPRDHNHFVKMYKVRLDILLTYTGCLKIREFRIQSVVGDHFSSPNMEIKKKSGLPPRRYIGQKVHSLKCVFFKYRLKSSVFIVIYGVDDCGK